MKTPTDTETELGVFEHFRDADGAVVELVRLGVPAERISVVCSEELPPMLASVDKVEGNVAERRIESVLTGSAVGALLGGLATATSVLATGGLGLVVIGPFVGGATAAGITGGLVGAMVSRGLEPDAADFYDRAVAAGEILVAVEPPASDSEPGSESVRDCLASRGARAYEMPAG